MITRFAPSPTGPLHLGHAYSAMLAHDMARAKGGRFHLRIDDLDQERSRPEWEAQIYEDLEWLGLSWDGPVRRQSDHFADYRAALERLALDGAVYPCRCSRKDIAAAAGAPQEGVPEFGPDGRIYPGTCRGRPFSEYRPGDALRYDLSKAWTHDTKPPCFAETGPTYFGEYRATADFLRTHVGDPVLARPGMAASYHFAVILDDAAQGVTVVIRGEDLFEAAFLQAFLGQKLGMPIFHYHHHRLIRDEAGKRLAKRDDARSLAKYRAEGLTPADIRAKVGL